MADPVTWGAIGTAVIGATASAVTSNQASKKHVDTPVDKSVTQDDSISQADDALRARQRQGTAANILSGVGGAGSPASTSTGQKTLLGG